MKRIITVAAVSVASLALAAPTAWHVFPETKSPNGRLAVAWGVPGIRTQSNLQGAFAVTNPRGNDVSESVKNSLFDISTKRTVAVLQGMTYYPRQNHNSISVKWASDSSIAFVRYDGKWEPISLTLVTSKGKQLALKEATMREAKRFLEAHYSSDTAYQAAKPNLTISIRGAEVLGTELPLVLSVTDGKIGNYNCTLFLRHFIAIAPDGAISLVRTLVADDPR
jgi:hypothetical protein